MSKYLLIKYMEYEEKARECEEKEDEDMEYQYDNMASRIWGYLTEEEKDLLSKRGIVKSLDDARKKNREILEKYNGK